MLNGDRPIVIVGGGPAGSSLAIRLRLAGRPVILIERETFPREKLCGEFISPECFGHFSELGVLDRMQNAGGRRITDTRFVSSRGRSFTIPTSSFNAGDYALGLSRTRMDAILLERARETGAEVIEGAAVTSVLVHNGRARGVSVRGPDNQIEIPAALIVDATGRHRVITRMASRLAGSKPPLAARYVGFKAHFEHIEIAQGICEIYSFRGGYGGLCEIEDGQANLCFLVTAAEAKRAGSADKILNTTLTANPTARRALRDARRTSDWIAVSFTNFGRQVPTTMAGIIAVGDAAAFNDPFTGSGILMALESSEMLDRIMAQDGPVDERALSRMMSWQFDRPLAVSRALRAAAFSQPISEIAIGALSTSATLRSMLARRTRDFRRG